MTLNRLGVLVTTIVTLAALVFVLVAISTELLSRRPEPLPDEDSVAEYSFGDFFGEDRHGFHSFIASGESDLATIQLQFADGPIVSAGTLDRESVASLLDESPDESGDIRAAGFWFVFDGDQLVTVAIDDRVDVRVGDAGQSMVKLPVTRGEMMRVFGAPTRFCRDRKSTQF